MHSQKSFFHVFPFSFFSSFCVGGCWWCRLPNTNVFTLEQAAQLHCVPPIITFKPSYNILILVLRRMGGAKNLLAPGTEPMFPFGITEVQEVSQQRSHTADKSCAKASFSHLPLSVFEGGLTRKLRFHNLNFRFLVQIRTKDVFSKVDV